MKQMILITNFVKLTIWLYFISEAHGHKECCVCQATQFISMKNCGHVYCIGCDEKNEFCVFCQESSLKVKFLKCCICSSSASLFPADCGNLHCLNCLSKRICRQCASQVGQLIQCGICSRSSFLFQKNCGHINCVKCANLFDNCYECYPHKYVCACCSGTSHPTMINCGHIYCDSCRKTLVSCVVCSDPRGAKGKMKKKEVSNIVRQLVLGDEVIGSSSQTQSQNVLTAENQEINNEFQEIESNYPMINNEYSTVKNEFQEMNEPPCDTNIFDENRIPVIFCAQCQKFITRNFPTSDCERLCDDCFSKLF